MDPRESAAKDATTKAVIEECLNKDVGHRMDSMKAWKSRSNAPHVTLHHVEGTQFLVYWKGHPPYALFNHRPEIVNEYLRRGREFIWSGEIVPGGFHLVASSAMSRKWFSFSLREVPDCGKGLEGLLLPSEVPVAEQQERNSIRRRIRFLKKEIAKLRAEIQEPGTSAGNPFRAQLVTKYLAEIEDLGGSDSNVGGNP
ncbi:MAG: hypothetical protein ACKOWJ_00940 [Micrococcales bacterium]